MESDSYYNQATSVLREELTRGLNFGENLPPIPKWDSKVPHAVSRNPKLSEEEE